MERQVQQQQREVGQISTVADMMNEEKMDICRCQRSKATYICLASDKGCISFDNQPQKIFCQECGEDYHSTHLMRINKKTQIISQQWALLIEKIHELASQFEDQQNNDKFRLIEFCQKLNAELPIDQQFSGLIIDRSAITQIMRLRDQSQNIKEQYEPIVSNYQILSLLEFEPVREDFGIQYEHLSNLSNIETEQIFEKFKNIFSIDMPKIQRVIDDCHLPFKLIEQIMKYKINMAVDGGKSEPQARSGNAYVTPDPVGMQLIESSRETLNLINMVDYKNQKQLEQINTDFNNKLDYVITLQENQRQQFQQIINNMQTQFQQIFRQETSRLMSEIEELQGQIAQQPQKSEMILNTYSIVNGNYIEQVATMPACTYQLFNTLQLLETKEIMCGSLNKKIGMYDPITLELKRSFDGPASDRILDAIQHPALNKIFYIDWAKNLHMVNSTNLQTQKSVTIKINEQEHDVIQLCLMDLNHIMVGTISGYICIYQFDNNSNLQLMKTEQLFGNNSVQGIVKLQREGHYAISYEGQGVCICKISTDNYEITRGIRYLNQQTVTCMIEYSRQRLICGSWTNNTYYLIDLDMQNEIKLMQGFTPIQGMTLFPRFDMEEMPFILTREMSCVCIINLKKRQIYRIIKQVPGKDFNTGYTKKGTSILFVDDKYGFVTYQNFEKYNIAKYKIDEKFIQCLQRA